MPSFARSSRRLSSTTSNCSTSSTSSCSSTSSVCRGPVRVVLLGGSGVGKTSILNRFLYNEFPTKHVPTLEQLHRAEYEIGHSVFTIDILDTSGTYEFTGMRHLAIDSGDAFVLVYSIDSEASFNEVERMRNEILERRMDVPIVVVGNKCDVESKRELNTEHIESLVTIEWEHGYVETSAKTDDNVIKVFTELMDRSDQHILLSPAARRRRDSHQSQKSSASSDSKKSSIRRSGRRMSMFSSSKHAEPTAATAVSCCVM